MSSYDDRSPSKQRGIPINDRVRGRLGEDCANLISYMENIVPFYMTSSKATITNNLNWNKVYHIQIHFLKSKVKPILDQPKR